MKRKASPVKTRTASTDPRLFFILFILVFLALIFSGCTAARTQVTEYRNPEELYKVAMEGYLDRRYADAEKDFKKLMELFPMSSQARDVELLLGDVCYAMEKYDESGSYYASFVAMRPAHPMADYALFQKGMSHFRDVLTPDRDQTSTRKALFAFEDLVRDYPGSPYYEKSVELISFLKRRLAERQFYIGHFYYKMKNYKAALSRFRDVLRDYPEDGPTDQTLYYIGESYRRLGEDSLAEDAYTTIIKDYPESPYMQDARKRLNGYL
ncbi:MAG TPA: outer membrane protein assembly factor BamD [Thermodesulfobacteriota bacterium]|nr:outer membrane protein assembly factor BamD [Thermodesulfobacteriota bacterium]